jgi:hypothetical protein
VIEKGSPFSACIFLWLQFFPEDPGALGRVYIVEARPKRGGHPKTLQLYLEAAGILIERGDV